MILFRSFLLFSALVFAATPSAAQSSDSVTRTTSSTSPRSGSSTSSTTTTSTSTSTAFGIITTTNSQGSTFVASIPITIPLNTTSSTTSSAPYPTLTGYPSCVTDCLTYAVARANCTSITAVNCYCPSRIFPDALYTCVAGNCSTDVPSAENLAQQFCALDNVTVSFSSTAAPPPSSSSPSSPSASAATSTSSSSSSSSNAASVSSWTSDTRGWTAMVAAACGALFGAALL
ncbi:hypothetical protein EDB92DRAFT_1842554 [Lactarius akahatsu]|uniref:CFEM domain-containing protein n=1 Tax=Lactarius akahatsu TaxID=416441 RepID=A0AAD4QDL6_9AGAM|nr:hypothetical protein EDB92DRAFT_1842554 [Lactarius akahatsu]